MQNKGGSARPQKFLPFTYFYPRMTNFNESFGIYYDPSEVNKPAPYPDPKL